MTKRLLHLRSVIGTLRGSVAISLAILMAFNPTRMVAAQPIGFNNSFSFGPISAFLNITPPVSLAPTGTAAVYSSTVHIHVADNSTQPPFVADLVAIGRASDPNTLVGGIAPAAIIVGQDLRKGLTFQTAAADALAKTGITVTFFQDASLAEYGLLLALIVVVCLESVGPVQPNVSGQACAIQSSLVNGLKTIDLAPIGGSQGLNLTPCNSVVIP